MKILIVAAYNKGRFSPFITDQVEALIKLGIDIDFFGIVGKGMSGYLKNRKKLIHKIASFHPDIIHAHFGQSGLLANLQRKVPVVTTYHGSDINLDKIFMLSKRSIWLSAFNIFVSEKNRWKAKQKKKFALIPCGVDIALFIPSEKMKARSYFNFSGNEKIVLFAGSFDNKIKNAPLAQSAVAQIDNVRLLELKDYTRSEVALLMNAVDVVLLTSFTEGSPQFIKEAMASNCPIVTVDVGDVKEVIADTTSCFVCSYNAGEIADKLSIVLEQAQRTNGRKRIISLGLDNDTVATKIKDIYDLVLKRAKK